MDHQSCILGQLKLESNFHKFHSLTSFPDQTSPSDNSTDTSIGGSAALSTKTAVAGKTGPNPDGKTAASIKTDPSAVTKDDTARKPTMDMSPETLRKTLKDTKSNIEGSQSSQSALAGAVLGLRGSPAYFGLIRDAATSGKLLAASLSNINKVLKIVEEGTGESGSVTKASLEFCASIVPIVNLLSVHVVGLMQQFSEWIDTCSELDIKDPLKCSVSFENTRTNDSFFNRMRLEIADLVESLDFTILREGSCNHAKHSLTRPKFQLKSIEEFTKESTEVKKKSRPRTVPSRPPSARSVRTIKASAIAPPVEPKSVPPKKKKLEWIRVEDITEIPEGVCITLT